MNDSGLCAGCGYVHPSPCETGEPCDLFSCGCGKPKINGKITCGNAQCAEAHRAQSAIAKEST